MSSRVGGAGLALTAAILLAVSILPVGELVGVRSISAWWSGHPTLGDHEYERKNVHIGLIKSTGCDIADDVEGKCQSLSLGTTFRIAKYVTFGIVSLLGLTLLLFAIARLRNSSRGGLARFVLVVASACSIAAVVLLLIGPDMKTGKPESIPIGLGLFLFFGGTGLSILTGVFGVMPARPQPAPGWPKGTSTNPSKPAVRPSQPPQPPTPQPVLDVLALLQEDALRPAALGPEPMMGRQPASPGGMLAGPQGPLAPPPPPGQPLFSAAPQLRPLYEANVNQGGTGGYVPLPQPPLPIRGPTPMPQAVISALTGVPPEPPAPPQRPKTLPPPVRGKPPSIAPPIPPPPTRPPPARSQATIMSAAAVPPPGMMGAPSSSSPHLPISTPGATLAGPPGMKLPIRAATDPDERVETVDFEKQTVALDPAFDEKATVALDAKEPGEEAALYATGDSTSPSVPFETVTNESSTFSSEIATHNDPDEEETKGREKISAEIASRPAIEVPRVSAAVMTSATLQPSKEPTPPAAAPAPPSTLAGALPPAKPAGAPSAGPLFGRATTPATVAGTPRAKTPSAPPAPAPTTPSTLAGALPPTAPPAAASAAPPASESPTMIGKPAGRRHLWAQSVAAPGTAPIKNAPQPIARKEPAAPKVPISTAPDSLPPPKEKPGAATSGPSPACPQCEAPMAWVEEHLRFYCKSCRMYF